MKSTFGGTAAVWFPHTSAEDIRHVVESILAPPMTEAYIPHTPRWQKYTS